MIYLICELFENGKGNDVVTYDHILYVPNISICNNNLLHDDREIHFRKDDIVIFSVNEDGMHYIQKVKMTIPGMYNKLLQIRAHIISKYPDINIYNDPRYFDAIGNKYKTYELLKNKYGIPLYDDFKNYRKWNTYPCIVSASRASGGRCRNLCQNPEELEEHGKNIQRTKGNTFIVQYIDSYIQDLDCYHNLRFMVVNNHIVDWFCRPGNGWNIHTRTQNMSKLSKCDIWFKNWYKSNERKVRMFIEQMYDSLGKGAYSYDCIICNDEIYLCEVGYKFWDDTFSKLIKMNKITNDSQKYKKLIALYIR